MAERLNQMSLDGGFTVTKVSPSSLLLSLSPYPLQSPPLSLSLPLDPFLLSISLPLDPLLLSLSLPLDPFLLSLYLSFALSLYFSHFYPFLLSLFLSLPFPTISLPTPLPLFLILSFFEIYCIGIYLLNCKDTILRTCQRFQKKFFFRSEAISIFHHTEHCPV